MDDTMHRFRTSATAAARRERTVFLLFRVATYLVVGCGVAVFLTIFLRGAGTVLQKEAPFVNTAFFTQAPESLYVFDFEGVHRQMGFREFQEFKAAHPAAKLNPETYIYSAGGIFPAIVGTLLLVVGSMTIALLLGVCAAIFLNEYARDGKFIRFVRLSIMNLAGVPSIVFGLFGASMFVVGFKVFGIQFFGWNTSLMAGWFTLAFMVLPVIITASEESLKAVPKGFREGSLALGATRWQTIRKNVLPYALPGILTSSILGIARVAGETAPIMFTAAFVVSDKLPWQVDHLTDMPFQGVMALPYHIYVVSSKIPQNAYTARVQYGTTFVFLLIVAVIASVSIILRNRLRNRYKW